MQEEVAPAATGASKKNRAKYDKKKAKKAEQKAQYPHAYGRKDTTQQSNGPESQPHDEQYDPPFHLPSDDPTRYEFREIEYYTNVGTFATRKLDRGERIMSCSPIVMNRFYHIEPSAKCVQSIDEWMTTKPELFDAFQILYINDDLVVHSRWLAKLMMEGHDEHSEAKDLHLDDHDRATIRLLRELYQGIHGPKTSMSALLDDPVFLRQMCVLAIYDSNRIFLERNEHNGSAVFEQASHINHSCRPNAITAWNEDTRMLTVHALRTIPKGTEITISYVPDGILTVRAPSRNDATTMLTARRSMKHAPSGY